MKDIVEVILEKEYIILKPAASPRKGWDKEFRKMSKNSDDKLLMEDIFDDKNLKEWN